MPKQPDSKPPKFPLKERFVWLWHPHFWLTLLLVVGVIALFLLFAK